MQGGTNVTQTYGFVYLPTDWTNYSVQASFQFLPAAGLVFAAGIAAARKRRGRCVSRLGAGVTAVGTLVEEAFEVV